MGTYLVKNSFRLGVCGVAALGLVACGSSSPSAAPPAPSPTGAASSSSPTQPMSSSSTPMPMNTPTAATNLAVNNQIRAALIAAGAKSRGLQASDFTSLRAGMTYYAYDPATQTYWAGGELVPSLRSYRAQVSSQDDGAYTSPGRPRVVGLHGRGNGQPELGSWQRRLPPEPASRRARALALADKVLPP